MTDAADFPLDQTARRVADALARLVDMPFGLDQSGTGVDGDAILSSLAKHRLAALRAPVERADVVDQYDPEAPVAFVLVSIGMTNPGLVIQPRQIDLRAEGVDLLLDLSRTPGLAQETDDLAHRIASELSGRGRGGEERLAREAAAILAQAAVDAFAAIVARLADRSARRAADEGILAARHVMDVCAAMIDVVRPERLQSLRVDLEDRTVSAVVSPPGGDDPTRIVLPLPDHVLAMLPATRLGSAFVDTSSLLDGESRTGLVVDASPHVADDHDQLEADPVRMAALLREHGGDGSDLAAAIDAALAAD